MDLYLQQHVFTFGDKFSVYDENENVNYLVFGEVFTFGKKLHICDPSENELLFIEQRLFTFRPKYTISRNGSEIAEVIREFTFFHQSYTVEGLGWEVEGDFFDHEYSIFSGDRTIATVSKEWFTFGDAYRISIDNGVNPELVLAVVLIIDACIEASRD